MDFDRRTLIAGTGLGLAGSAIAANGLVDLGLPGGPGLRPLSPRFPQKGAMIVQRVRPPLLETPFEVFDSGVITPNDRFFVRWSGGDMPTRIDADSFRLTLRGAVKAPQQLSLAEVARAGKTVEVTAVNQCAGNGRGFSQPRVGGAQWGHGAMGNAMWRGVRLRDVLDKAGVGSDAKRVRFAGLDKPLIDGAPQKVKSIPIDIARRDDVLVAWAMNGEALPLLNGYPLRLVVPGWFATYWIKMLSDIEVMGTDEDDSYFMAKTYRMPAVPVQPGDKDFPTVPITTMGPRSWITSHVSGDALPADAPLDLRGLAMGGDTGVAHVDILVDNLAATLQVVRARLEGSDDPYGFRRWSVRLPRQPAGLVSLGARCTNKTGQSQPSAQPWNPSGYARTVVEPLRLRVV
jgi:DMSO/TMAO reductase YedYZ molybdopterin-dependent catalytic subunit